MTSTRLPGKVLMEAAGHPMLWHHVRRARESGLPIIIATTTNATDDAIVDFCEREQVPYWRGSEDNVLSRFHDCAKHFGLKYIVRVTSDCPLLDGHLIKEGTERYLLDGRPHLYLSNGIVRTYPRGFDFEIFSFEMLSEAYHNAVLPMDLEHVTPYIHQNRNGKTVFSHFVRPEDKSNYRITLDTQDDFDALFALIDGLGAASLGAEEIIALLDQHPEIVAMNAHIEQKKC